MDDTAQTASRTPQPPPKATPAAGSHAERERFFGAAKLVAAITLLSRIAGMLRASAIASLGANATTDAFALAFKVPNLFRRLFAEGALSAAFVPVFTETMAKGGHDSAAKLLANATALLATFLTALMVLVQLGLAAWAIFWPGSAERQLAMLLTGIMLPFMVTVCLLALGSAVLNCRGHFLYPAFTPVLLNIVIVAAAWWVAPMWRGQAASQLVVVAVSVSVAGVVQLAGVLWLLRRAGFRMPLRLRPVEGGIGRMLHTMAPMLLGLGFLQLEELLVTMAASFLSGTPQSPQVRIFGWTLDSPLQAGILQRLDAARYLYQFPMGVLAVSLGVAVFPLMARYAAADDKPNLRDAVNRAVRLSFMEGMATGAGLFVLAEPITWILYRHGNFTAADVRLSADILRFYSLGMWAFCTYQIFARAFYAIRDVKTPLKVQCVLAVVDLLLVLGLVWVPWIGPRAFAVGPVVVFSVNVLAMAIILRRRLGRFGGRKLAVSAARTLAATGAMVASLYGLLWALEAQPQWLKVLCGVPVGAAVFIGAALALRAPEIGELLGAVRNRRAARGQGRPTEPAV
jgi:putative peptidoglycan lipid II flippase